jgi:flagellar hook-associated protein 1 FlgK
MGTVFSALGTAANALDVLQQAIGVVQNNVVNASTPGYVTQTLNLVAQPFDPAGELWGGVSAGSLQSARDVFAEQSVQSANTQVGLATQLSSSLSALQNNFDISGKSGVAAGVSGLSSAFSAWSANPTDSTARQQVLTAAQTLSQAFNQTAASVQQLSAQTDQQLSTTVSQVNQYAAQIASINGAIRQGGQDDQGLQTQLYNAVEQLSNLAPVQAQTQSDGTATILLGGQAPLVIGQTANALSVSYNQPASPANPGAPPDATLSISTGQDVTALATGGQLGALVQFRNQTVPSILGDSNQQGSLNQLAQGFADSVNTRLTGGQVSAGPPPVPGIALFTYTPASPTDVASTLTVNPAISSTNLAAIDPSTGSANGVASALAALATSQSTAYQINGLSYTDFYSSIASGIGTQAASASTAQTSQTQILTQAQNVRAQVSGVSLNAQATTLLGYQESYQALAQVISTVNLITQGLLTTFQNMG